jgi:hypothetical protein
VLKDNESAMLVTDSLEGERARREFGKKLYAINLESMVPTGLNFGYAYGDSPIIAHDGATPPRFTMGDYTASTIPGCRLPHFWLADGTSLYDALGAGYTLLGFDPAVAVEPLLSAAQRRAVPLAILDVQPGREFDPDVYAQSLILVRPDQHIAWRGNALPADCEALIDLIRGAAIVHIEQKKVA